MRWNVLEVAENGRYLKLYRGFILVMNQETELGRVIIDELNCVLLTAEQATLSKPVMVRLAEQGIPIIICGKNYHPISINLPYSNHHHSNRILHLQIACSKPLKKRLWQDLVKSKIQNQTQVLEHCRPEQKTIVKQLNRIQSKTRSGDPENCEAQAARIYWQALFGKRFRRQKKTKDITNLALNYGYTIIRAACARGIVAAGLNPSLGLHHNNFYNPFCLADDLMEIYRPLVDLAVFNMKLYEELNPNNKSEIAKVLQADIESENLTTTVASSIHKLCHSVVKSLENKGNDLQTPKYLIN